MPLRDPIKDHWSEQRLFANRALIGGGLALLLVLAVVTRLVVLQVVNYEYFKDLSQGNRVRIEPLPPTRGLIFDRNGVLLAENVPAYQLELTPEQVDDLDGTLARLAALDLMRLEDEVRFRKSLAKSKRRFIPIPVRFRLSDDELARFSVKRQHFPGVEIRARLARHYPLGKTAVHAIGYVGSVSTDDLDRLDPAAYAGTTHVGKTGVERAYEYLLHGKVGHQQVLVNARGRALEVLSASPPTPGKDLYLTLDANMQRAAEQALGDWRGAVVAIDPRNGDVLTFASTPAFDPNPFGEGLTTTEFDALTNDPLKPMFNRALGGNYPPGSTIKPFLGLANLHYRAMNPREPIYCPGQFSLPGNDHKYRDWKPEGHGYVNLSDSLEQSCDVYFYQLSLELGIDRMHKFMDAFGFGSLTGIDIMGEKRGLMPSREWKRDHFSDSAERVWFPGETLITGIGQGFTLATPLQLAHATATLAARGRRYQPKLIDAERDPLSGDIEQRGAAPLPTVQLANPAYWQQIIDAMVLVVHGKRGTARATGIGSTYRMAGKTGTAQLFSIGQEEEYDDTEVAEELRHHGWFVAFAPQDNPQVAIAVLVENGGSGSASAAPVARQVLDAFFSGGNSL